MEMLVLVLAIVLFAILAFKRVSTLILAPLVCLFVILCYQMPILSSLKDFFMPSAAKYVSSYFLIFFVGGLFGAIYQFTGAAESLAKFLAGLCKGRYVAPIIMCITGVLTFGGISGFVVFFVIYPIAVQMFKQAKLTRRLIPAAISAGTWTWSMTGPGSPSIQNAIAMNSLGTSAIAAFVPSLIVTVAEFIMIFVFLEYRARKFTRNGIVFDDPKMTYQLSAEELGGDESKSLPHAGITFIPIGIILVLFNVFHLGVEVSVFWGIMVALALFFKRLRGLNEWIDVLNSGAMNSGSSIMNTAIVVGFGGLVQNTQAFANLVANLKSLSLSPLVFVMITVAICAGACGSASGGMGVAFNALKDTFIGLGANLEHVHRVAAIAAGTLDTLPHQGAQITLLNICKTTHREAYYDIMVTQIIIPFITVGLFIFLVSIGIV